MAADGRRCSLICNSVSRSPTAGPFPALSSRWSRGLSKSPPEGMSRLWSLWNHHVLNPLPGGGTGTGVVGGKEASFEGVKPRTPFSSRRFPIHIPRHHHFFESPFQFSNISGIHEGRNEHAAPSEPSPAPRAAKTSSWDVLPGLGNRVRPCSCCHGSTIVASGLQCEGDGSPCARVVVDVGRLNIVIGRGPSR